MNHNLIRRHNMLTAIRAHFNEQDFIETQTPVRVEAPALEDYIDAIPSGDLWLRTSPELHMKRLIAAGMKRIYQIGPCFRADEHGNRHRCEFTMLEWYQANADYRDLIPFIMGFIRQAAIAVDSNLELDGDWEILSVDEAFLRYAGMTAATAYASSDFDPILVEQIEPHLGQERPTFLIDYPAELGALARLKPNDPTVAERWELYINGLEIANTYSELIDPEEQRRRFEATAALREEDNRAVYPIDEAFMTALPKVPPTAGSALGIDRLFMALIGTDNIADALAFGDETA
ncbi:EF-P lysine aminoacylase GenX [bacterium M21]|nr:EF-P lysine aminoacylase GenX [bacterium M21]